MRTFEAAIFDMDGTLIDSMGVWEKIDRVFLGKRGLDVPEDYLVAINGIGFVQTAEYTIRRFGLPETPEELMTEWSEMAIYEYSHNIGLKPGVKEYLKQLCGKGIPLGIATASPKELYEPVLRRNGIYDLFSAICSTDLVKVGKDQPDIYLHVAEKLGVSPERCMVFEDVLIAIRSAKKAKMAVCGVYDPFAAPDAEQIKREADTYITDFTQLLEK